MSRLQSHRDRYISIAILASFFIGLGVATAEERYADGDSNKQYFLIGGGNDSKPPAKTYRLLVVLPGGDGGPDFNPFVRRIHQNALNENYLVAQLVAKKWNRKQAEQLVWPTNTNMLPGVKFSTEEFVDTVIRDVERTHEVDSAHVYTLSWSSGGPAAYATSLKRGTKVKGSFVAMSVFKPNQLPSLVGAKNHSYYILHSPTDFIPISMAKTARNRLAASGASTWLQTYKGGHGWRGDVYGMIRNGITWLEQQHGRPIRK